MLLNPQLNFQSHRLSIETRPHSPCTLSGSSPQPLESWDKTRRNLVSKWWNRARGYSRKQGLVRSLISTKAQLRSPDRIASAHATSAKVLYIESDASEKRSGTGASICSSSVLCRYDSAAELELDLKVLESYGFDCRNLSDLFQQLQDLTVSMAKHRSASAAKNSSKSSTDERDGRGQTPEQYLAAKKREAVEAVMAVFNKWLDTRLAVISYAYEASEGSDGSSGGSSGWKSGDGNSGSPSGSRGRPKRQLSNGDLQDGSSAGGDGDGNGNGQDRGGNKRARTDNQGKPMFACPFFQHDPSRHSTHRSCTGPGWVSIHRLKEHLTRIHRLKNTCPRCREPMADAAALEEHLRSDIPCTKRDVTLVQGIDDAQEKKLKERRKTSSTLTDEQKWKDIYMILFPTANKNALPSAYYDSRDSPHYAKSAAEWKKLKKRIQKELPKAVQSRVEQRFEGLQVEVLHSLPEIVREEVFHIFKMFPQGSSAPGTPGPSSRSATPKAFDPVSGADDSKAINLETFFSDPNAPIMLFGAPNDYEFDQQFLNFDPEGLSDSGYASNSTVTAPTRRNCNWL